MLLGLGALGLSLVQASREGAEEAYRETTLTKQGTVAALTDQYLQLAAKEAFEVGAAQDMTMTPGDVGDRSVLEELLAKQGGFFNYGAVLALLDGTPVNAVAPGGDLPPPDDPGYAPLRASLARGEAGISSVMHVGDTPLVAVGVPVLDGSAPEGVLYAFFRADTSHLQRYSSQLGVGSAATGMVVDSVGTVVAARDIALVGKPAPTSPALGRADEAATADFTRDGIDMFAAWAPVPTGSWLLVEEQPASAFYAPLRGQSQTAQLALLGLLVAGAAAVTILNHRTVRARRSGERRCEALVQDASDVITVVDDDGTITYISPAVEHVLGFSPEDRTGTRALDLIHPDDQDRVRTAVTSVSASHGARQRLQARAVRADGTTCSCEFVISNLVRTRGVEGVVVSLRDITELAQLHDELAHRATHDPLTSLPNRAQLQETVTDAITATVTPGQVATLFLDLDGFKAVNDELGHDAGDAILVEVAERLRDATRAGDSVARIGGDEFVMVVRADDDARAAAENVAIRALDLLHQPFAVADREVSIGVSIGIAIGAPGETSDALLRRADAAMYRAKHAGRGRIVIDDDGDGDDELVTAHAGATV